jgi:DNA polymerase-3 subunit epsilon
LTALYKGSLVTREMAQKLAIEHGLIVKKGVTKDLDYLVTADPDSMSGKAKKARQYNTKILAEQTFWNLLGLQF